MTWISIGGHTFTVTGPMIVVGIYFDVCTVATIIWWRKGKVIR